MSGGGASFRFSGEVIHWRGPSPFFFVTLPDEIVAAVREAGRTVSYGWGMVPVAARIGAVDFTSALFPKDGGYLLPLRDRVRAGAGVSIGDAVTVEIEVVAKPRSRPR